MDEPAVSSVEPTADAELSRRFAESSVTSLPRAPLYAALSAGIARDPDLYRLLNAAPEMQRLPVILFAATHDLLLDDTTHPLAAWYPNLTADHRAPTDRSLLPTFKRFVADREPLLKRLLATRTVQTNEVGRCALLLPVLGMLSDEMGALGHLDVGASGGLNLLFDRYRYVFTPRGAGPDAAVTVGGTSSVVLSVETTGDVPVPDRMPAVAARCGIDRSPIDVTDEGEAHWLEACVWPDQAERFHRLVEAIEIARERPPELLAGDAVESLAPAIDRIGRAGHPVVTNSWVLNYLTGQQRRAYLAELERIGRSRDLSWVYAEAPALIPELPNEPDTVDAHRTVLSLARWRNGERTVEHLATCHPHGFWINWR